MTVEGSMPPVPGCGEDEPHGGPRCLIATHQQADLDGFASLLAASLLHPHCLPVLPGGAGAELRRLLAERPHLAERIHALDAVELDQVTCLVLVDCRQAERIGPLRGLAADERVRVLSYDHHPAQPGDVERGEHVSGATGANSTLLVECLRAQDLEPSPEEATLLALGIFEDTGGLTYAGVSPRDLQALAWLLERGADLVYVGRFLRQELSAEQVQLLDRLLANQQALEVGGKRILLTAAVVDQYIDEAAVVVSRMLDMERPEAIFALLAQGPRISVIARAAGDGAVPVHEIAQTLGGGGHPMAAAATLRNVTLAEAEEQVLAAIHQRLSAPPRAEDIMARPVHSAAAGCTVAAGLALLGRYPHRGMPVLDEQGRPVGYVHRRLLENAQRHGLGDRPLADYAEPLPIIAQDSRLAAVREVLRHSPTPMLGVVDTAGRLSGVITPADLRHLELTHALPPSHPLGPRNLARRLRGQWGERRTRRLRELGQAAAEIDLRAYLVGGSVRDLLLNQSTQDLDVVVEGEAPALARRLQERTPGVRVVTHAAFGTATLIFPDGERLDLASSRVEHYAAPAALPMIELGGIHADLWRRDFTINAMAMDIHPARFGDLLDPYHGLTDLRERRIRILHSLSFVEDPTRILRAVRFEARLGFCMDEQSQRLALNALHLGVFEQLSGARLWRELRYLFDLPQAAAAWERLGRLHLWTVLRGEPAKDPTLLLARGKRALEMLQWYHLLFRPEAVRPWAVLLRVLLGDLAEPALRRRLHEFQLAARDAAVLLADLRQLRPLAQRLRERLEPWPRYQALAPVSLEGLLALMAWSNNELLREQVSDYIQHQYDLALPLDGADLLALGVPQGPRIGEWLQRLRRAVVEGRVQDRETAQGWIRQGLQQETQSP
ncbi:MAG: DHHA1 domain-containing protein [Pseudomonadota bacterium]